MFLRNCLFLDNVGSCDSWSRSLSSGSKRLGGVLGTWVLRPRLAYQSQGDRSILVDRYSSATHDVAPFFEARSERQGDAAIASDAVVILTALKVRLLVWRDDSLPDFESVWVEKSCYERPGSSLLAWRVGTAATARNWSNRPSGCRTVVKLRA